MNVLHILDGRTSREMLGQLALLRGDGEAVVSLGPPPDEIEVLGAPVRSLHRPLGVPALGGFTLRRPAEQADMLHFWSLSAAEAMHTLPPRRPAHTLLSLPCVPTGRAMRSLTRLIATGELRLILPTEADRSAALASGLAEHALTVLPVATDAPDEQERSRRRARARGAMGIVEETTLLVAPAEMHRDAGHKYASWAHAIIRQIIPDLLLAMPTGGPAERRVEWFSNTTGYGKEISLPHDWPAELDRMDALAAADVVLIPAGRPVSTPTLAAAMAAGAAIVATDLPAHAELAPHEHAALLAPKDDPRALSAATLRLIKDRDLAARLGAAARSEAVARFAPPEARNRLAAIYGGAARPSAPA